MQSAATTAAAAFKGPCAVVAQRSSRDKRMWRDIHFICAPSSDAACCCSCCSCCSVASIDCWHCCLGGFCCSFSRSCCSCCCTWLSRLVEALTAASCCCSFCCSCCSRSCCLCCCCCSSCAAAWCCRLRLCASDLHRLMDASGVCRDKFQNPKP